MYIIRDIFHLQFGHYRDAKELLDSAIEKSLLPQTASARVLTDFTGDAYRLIFEASYPTLTEYEQSLQSELNQDEWKSWYEKFKKHVIRSHREILKQVM